MDTCLNAVSQGPHTTLQPGRHLDGCTWHQHPEDRPRVPTVKNTGQGQRQDAGMNPRRGVDTISQAVFRWVLRLLPNGQVWQALATVTAAPGGAQKEADKKTNTPE